MREGERRYGSIPRIVGGWIAEEGDFLIPDGEEEGEEEVEEEGDDG